MPMIGARFYRQLEATELRNDIMENELAKEMENGRLFRLLVKLGMIVDRPQYVYFTSFFIVSHIFYTEMGI